MFFSPADDFEEHHFYEEKKNISTISRDQSKAQHHPAKKIAQIEPKGTSHEAAIKKKELKV